MDERPFTAKTVLDDLRRQCGDGEFGYRMQAFFAHVLLRLGARVTMINTHGHPDLRARMSAGECVIQVKTVSHASSAYAFQATIADLEGIRPTPGCRGYLAILDCAVPVGWHLIEADRATSLIGRAAQIATLRAMRTEPLSTECTDVFLDLIESEKHRLPLLSYRLLADRALRGEAL